MRIKIKVKLINEKQRECCKVSEVNGILLKGLNNPCIDLTLNDPINRRMKYMVLIDYIHRTG